VAFNAAYSLSGLTIHGQPLFSFGSPVGVFEKLGHFVSSSSTALWRFAEPDGLASPSSRVYVVAFWLSALVAALTRSGVRLTAQPPATTTARRLDLGVVVYAALYFTLAILSRYELEPYHLVPLLVMLLLPMSASLMGLWERGSPAMRLLTAALATPLLAFGLVANARLVHPSRLGASLRLDPRDHLQFGVRVATVSPERLAFPPLSALNARLPPAYGDDTPVFLRFFRTAPADLLVGETSEKGARDAWFLTGYGLALWHRDHPAEPERQKLRAYLAQLEPAARDSVLQGYGFALCPPDACPASDWSRDIPPEGHERVAFGLGRSTPLSRFLDTRGRSFLERLPAALHPSFVAGLGYELGLRSLRPWPRGFAAPIPGSLRTAFWGGVSEGMAARTAAPPPLGAR
jgi:hypothetical protein